MDDNQIAAFLNSGELHNHASIAQLIRDQTGIDKEATQRIRLRLTRLRMQFPEPDGYREVGSIPVPAWNGQRWIDALTNMAN